MRTPALPLLKLTAAATIAAALAALPGCGGDSSASNFTGTGGSSSSSGGTSGSTPVVALGGGTGSSFNNGTLLLGVSSLSAGGSTTVTANLVDTSASNTAYTTSTDVTFTSTCSNQNLASMTSPVTTTTGNATSTYVAKGCSGTDTITAVASVNGKTLTASANITVEAAALGSIQFESADPTDISLKGMGGSGSQETSTVKFIVKDETGGIVPNTNVTFKLSTSVGGITLSPTSAKTDANGEAQTVVQAGTVATPVSVIASVTKSGTIISTQSGELTIHSGIPAENAFSLAVDTHNLDAWGKVAIPTDTVTVQLGDRFNNPVPDGTTVQFHAEGGIIEPSCKTTNGTCTVTWSPGNPVPADGRSTITAYAVGEESFTDNNGNGVFDSGDSFSDIPEIYEDDNENLSYDSGEFFYDFNKDKTYTAADGKWEGVNCQHPTKCATRTSTGVGSSNLIIMSSETPIVTVTSSTNYNAGSNTLDASASPAAITFLITDINGNPMPIGTTFAVSTNNGTLASNPTITVGDETAISSNDSYPVSIATDGTSSDGILTLTIKSGGTTTLVTVNVHD